MTIPFKNRLEISLLMVNKIYSIQLKQKFRESLMSVLVINLMFIMLNFTTKSDQIRRSKRNKFRFVSKFIKFLKQGKKIKIK